ncbi:MAG: Hsp20/alpha crystallin family protein [Proteobacteria bacterium]|nr:Hsp20/alpha crystallin family protein [Pseudomonadota bacterium]
MNNIDLWRNRSLVPARLLGAPLSSNFFRRMDRLIEDFMNEFSDIGAREGSAQSFEPPCDLMESDDKYQLCIDLPGMHARDVNVEVIGNSVTVWGERKTERKTEKGGTQYHERRLGAFERRVQLPENVNAEKIQAHFDAGVLTVMLPKAGHAQKKKINVIESGSQTTEIKIEGKKEGTAEHKKSA